MSTRTKKDSSSSKIAKRKLGETKGGGENPNAEICKLLLELADYEKTAHGEQWKNIAYRKAAQTLTEHKTAIRSGKEAKKLPGIGDSIAEKIDEFLNTGKIKKVKEARQDEEGHELEDLARVPGIGHANARRLLDEGIHNISELREHEDQLNDAQKVGLKYLEDIEIPISKTRMKQIEKYLVHELKQVNKNLNLTICGAYRRGEKNMFDVVAVVAEKSATEINKELLHQIVGHLKAEGFIVDTISVGDHRFRGICSMPEAKGRPVGSHSKDQGGKQEFKRQHHLLELVAYPESQYYTGILQWTGSNVFVEELHSKAKQKGYLLNEYGLFRDREGSGDRSDNAVKISSEEDVFKKLDMDYVKPQDRSV